MYKRYEHGLHGCYSYIGKRQKCQHDLTCRTFQVSQLGCNVGSISGDCCGSDAAEVQRAEPRAKTANRSEQAWAVLIWDVALAGAVAATSDAATAQRTEPKTKTANETEQARAVPFWGVALVGAVSAAAGAAKIERAKPKTSHAKNPRRYAASGTE
jgi:hypothetical protein